MSTLLLGIFALALQTLTFDVVSVKPSNPNTPGMSVQTNRGRFFGRGATLQFLVQYAYRLKPAQIIGGPSWLTTDRFEVEGRFNGDDNKDNDDKLLLMLQSALTDRFKLRSHREMRDMPVFVLTVAKGGPKLKPTGADPIAFGMRGGRGAALGPNTHTLSSTGASMANLAAQLSQGVGRNVIDQTGLTGKYDFKLEWVDDLPAAAGDLAPSGPSLFTALEEQLGLKLESARAPLEVLVIDSAEKPAEN